jgi:dimethylargininase
VAVIAITREISDAVAACELTYLERRPIDVARARRQHAGYERALAAAGCRVERLPSGPDMPDSVFVEDIAVVFDEVAIVTRPGAPSRRVETEAVAAALKPYRRLECIAAPATVDGGDIIVAGRRVLVGQSRRSNPAAVDQMRRVLLPLGYQVEPVSVGGCLHLKSAATALNSGTLLVNPDWLDVDRLNGFEIVSIDRTEPHAANVLRVSDTLIAAADCPRTIERLESRGHHVVPVDVSELAKAEGAVTCCSLIVR